jgi:hypothetical protein
LEAVSCLRNGAIGRVILEMEHGRPAITTPLHELEN